jgi:hypothetical protein
MSFKHILNELTIQCIIVIYKQVFAYYLCTLFYQTNINILVICDLLDEMRHLIA